MKITKTDLVTAAGQGGFGPEQAEELWKRLEAIQSERPHFSAIHVAYYFGAMIVISAMGWFMNLAWESMGGTGIMSVSILYMTCFCLAGRTLWKQPGFQIPGGLLFTMAVGMVPLAVYGIERMTGLWPQGAPDTFRDYHIYVKGSWVLMEVATIAAAGTALYFIRFPFLTAPIAFSLWYMSMDLTPLLFGKDDFEWREREWVSVCFGLVILLVSYLADRRTDKDYSFWGYFFGLLAFWGGLSLMESGSQWARFGYCLINVGLVVASLLLERRVFIVFGALGVSGYLGNLAYNVIEHSVLFPFALTFLGVVVIALAVQYQKHAAQIERAVFARIPPALLRVLPRERHPRG